jgi:hypothetical protein
MTLEGHFCWEDCDEGPHGCVCGNDCPPPPLPPLPLDLYPWYVEEADDGKPPFGRYTHADYNVSSEESEHGGIVYNLAKWAPREGFSQERKDYA